MLFNQGDLFSIKKGPAKVDKKMLHCVFYTKKEPALVSGWTFICAYLADISHTYLMQVFVLDSDWFI